MWIAQSDVYHISRLGREEGNISVFDWHTRNIVTLH